MLVAAPFFGILRLGVRGKRVLNLVSDPIKKLAERVGFEPTVPCDTPHFECGALDQLCDLSSLRNYSRSTNLEHRGQRVHAWELNGLLPDNHRQFGLFFCGYRQYKLQR